MGFVLFTTSGQFKPSSYGLAPGDILSVVVVGGGGGGCGYSDTSSSDKPGTAGKTSSFGSYLTASGGGSGNAVGQSKGGRGTGRQDNLSTYFAGGGAGGWYPGIQRVNCPGMPGYLGGVSPGEIALLDSNGGCGAACRGSYDTATDSRTIGTGGGGGGAGQSGSLAGVGGAGGSSTPSDSTISYGAGGGGAGYGAGGGGGSRSSYYNGGDGGNSGVVKQGMVKLTSTNSIPVTVGAGGAGHSNGGGAGAPGCVAIFW